MSSSLVHAPTEARTYGRPGQVADHHARPQQALGHGLRVVLLPGDQRGAPARGHACARVSRSRSASRSAPSAAAASTSSKPAASSTSSEAAAQALCSRRAQAEVEALRRPAQLELERALGVGDGAEARATRASASSRRPART